MNCGCCTFNLKCLWMNRVEMGVYVCSFRVSAIWHILLSASSGDQSSFEFGADVMKPLQGQQWFYIGTYVEVKFSRQPSNPLRALVAWFSFCHHVTFYLKITENWIFMKQSDTHDILIVATTNGLGREPPEDIFLCSDTENNEIQSNGDTGE